MINAIIVDDEPFSREILKKYLSDTPGVELVEECRDAGDAKEALDNYSVDLIFLDINMPGISGLQFIRSLNQPPLVVFTTAYPEFALEGFEVDAVDYLLKPYSFERFLKSVNKAEEIFSARNKAGQSHGILWLKSDKKINQVLTSEIIYIEATGDYIKVVCNDRRLLVHETMQSILNKLDPGEFVRIHRSYIVSLRKVNYVEGNRLIINDEKLPLGESFKTELFAKIKKS